MTCGEHGIVLPGTNVLIEYVINDKEKIIMKPKSFYDKARSVLKRYWNVKLSTVDMPEWLQEMEYNIDTDQDGGEYKFLEYVAKRWFGNHKFISQMENENFILIIFISSVHINLSV